MKKTIANEQAIALVRRAQKAIARDHMLRDLSQYPSRDSFREAAQLVVEHYYPAAVRRANTANVEDLVEVLLHAFVLAPLEYRLPGVYRPDWGIGTCLSWFRRCLGKNSGQWFWCRPHVSIDRSPEAVRDQFTQIVGIRDSLFATTAAEVMANLAASGGRKAIATRQYLDPFAAARFDMQINERFHVRASGPIRRKLRAEGRWVASYLRQGDDAVLLADAPTARASDGDQFQWQDIRSAPIQWRDYTIEWMNKDQHLRIQVDQRVIAAALREMRGIEKAVRSPHARYAAMVRFARRFLSTHRFATGSLEALREFNGHVQRRVSKRITSVVRSLVYPITSVQVYDRLVLPITNPFLITDTSRASGADGGHGVSNATWMSFWNPYRATAGGYTARSISEHVDEAHGVEGE